MNGLSTLNRLLGKRNKDVSKSTSNLSRSTTNLDTSSQYNKVVPLAAMNNAPFEQTFRITVLLPRDQLYVARVGAKTKLSALLQMVCTDKLLDAQKYLFRHPTDFQQGFELSLTIGEVGLNEIRLMSRKELEALRNNEYRLSTSDIFRMHQKNARETSVSSSDLSRTSKLALKTTSPYSSTNSLNSMDSSGVSSSSRGGTTNGHHQAPVAPVRKKRLAPRPPSQNSIPEQHAVKESDHIFKEPQLPPYSRKNFHVSSPNLYDRELKAAEIVQNNNNNHNSNNNNNTNVNNDNNNNDDYKLETNNNRRDAVEERNNFINTKTSFSTLKNRPTSMYIIREPVMETNGNMQQTTNGGSMVDIHHSRTSSNSSEAKDPRDFHEGPEPTPRKRLSSNAKKSKAPAPAPPPRQKSAMAPTPSPRIITRSTLDLRDNETVISETDSNFSEADDVQRNRETVNMLNAVNSSIHQAPPAPAAGNISKVMLNVDQTSPLPVTPEPEKKKPVNGASSVSIKITGDHNGATTIAGVSPPKVASPIISKIQIGGPVDITLKEEPNGADNSSDEEIKIYNIESGKTLITKLGKEQPTEEPTVPTASNGTEMEEEQQWTYTLPAPPTFSDASIKANDYEPRTRFIPVSTYADNTTIMSDRMTVQSEPETEEIKPIIKERILMDDSLVDAVIAVGNTEDTAPNESEISGGNDPELSPLITSDIEDGYHGGALIESEQNERMALLQTLEKRREKIIEGELQQALGETVTKGITVTRSLSVIEQRSEVMHELNQFLQEGVELGKKETYPLEEIAGANRSSLSNFKISTYSVENKENIVVEGDKEPKVSELDGEELIVRRKISADCIRKLSSDEDDTVVIRNGFSGKKELAPVKRRSLTVLNKSPKNINRSDSFHSTRSDYIQSLHSANLQLTPRSTSYISLIGAQRFENRTAAHNFTAINRRKSTSEVSITDSPSLQSLEVIKNILNTSRKNSVNNLQQSGEDATKVELSAMATIKRNSFTDISTLAQFGKGATQAPSAVRKESIEEVGELKVEEEVVLRDITKHEEMKKIDEVVMQVEKELAIEKQVEKFDTMSSMKIEEIRSVQEVTESTVLVPDLSNESKSDDEKLQNKQQAAKEPQTTVVSITTTSTTVTTGNGVPAVPVDAEQDSKKWTYQGPPTINFTTWSERPKIDVSIKSDRDYRFGGSSTLPRGFRNVNNTTKINITTSTPTAVTLHTGTTGVDEVDSNAIPSVPFATTTSTTILNAEQPVSLDPETATHKTTIVSPERLPIVRAVEYKKNIVPPAVEPKPYFYDTFSRNPGAGSGVGVGVGVGVGPIGGGAVSTINRLSLGGKFAPTVRGFRSLEDKDPTPKLRPVSMIEPRSDPAVATTPSLPFSQHTLRRTGLKEKILAPSEPTVASAAVLAPSAPPAAPKPPPPPPSQLGTERTPVVRGAIVKKALPTPSVDPRAALLDAIRSFNKDALRKE